MRTTIDKAGRVVIPKPIRDALGLTAGAEVDIEIEGLAVRMEGVHGGDSRLKEVDGLLVIAADPNEPRLTVDEVRRLRLDLQR
jgi:AbrB family looped-hinge helix DNA binding protein